jgi:hypothetical protein
MYDYKEHRQRVFTEEGQVTFIKTRDRVHHLLKTAGAFRESELGGTGDSWLIMACVDRLVELCEIVPLRDPTKCWRQFQVYASPEVSSR